MARYITFDSYSISYFNVIKLWSPLQMRINKYEVMHYAKLAFEAFVLRKTLSIYYPRICI